MVLIVKNQFIAGNFVDNNLMTRNEAKGYTFWAIVLQELSQSKLIWTSFEKWHLWKLPKAQNQSTFCCVHLNKFIRIGREKDGLSTKKQTTCVSDKNIQDTSKSEVICHISTAEKNTNNFDFKAECKRRTINANKFNHTKRLSKSSKPTTGRAVVIHAVQNVAAKFREMKWKNGNWH